MPKPHAHRLSAEDSAAQNEMLHNLRIRWVLRFGEKDVNSPWTFLAHARQSILVL
jgi:hypothetical protein